VSATTQEVISKVRKLFELSKSSNENEAALALAKAREMLSKHNLSMADLTFEQLKSSLDVTSASVLAGKVLRVWVKALIFHVAKGFQCEHLIQRRYDEPPLVLFIGAATDAEVACYAFSFLYGELNGLADRALPRLKRETRGWTAAALRYAYLEGAVVRIGQRFDEETQQVRAVENVECRDLILAKDQMINNYMHETFPRMRKEHHKPRPISTTAFDKGYHDAQDVNLRPGSPHRSEDLSLPAASSRQGRA
jgi:hypothetical protein